MLIAMGKNGLGIGQTWQVVARVSGTIYQNLTGNPIAVSAFASVFGVGGAGTLEISPATPPSIQVASNTGQVGDTFCISAIIPANHYYRFNINAGAFLIQTTELRP
jgi:hypothetical protein